VSGAAKPVLIEKINEKRVIKKINFFIGNLLLRVLLLKTTATRFGSKILRIIEEASFFWGDNDNYSCSAGWDLRSLKKKH